MKYGANVFFNQNPAAMLPTRGFKDGDELRITPVVVFPEAESAQAAADQVFTLLNLDARPNRFIERSVSVGDVIRIVVPPTFPNGEGHFEWFACADIGWTPIKQPKGAF